MRRLSAAEIEHLFVDVTPTPGVWRIVGFHDGVAAGMEMFGCVLVLRIVTATNVTAGAAYAQVHPAIAGLQTIFAAVRGRNDVAHGLDMWAGHTISS